MTTIESIRKAINANANDARNNYWRALEAIASGATQKQKDSALKKAARAANDIGADAEQLEADVQLLRERNSLPDADQIQRDAETEGRQLIDEAASLEAEAAAATARAKELTEQASTMRNRARAARNRVTSIRQRERALRQALGQRGFPVALIEAEVEQQQHELRRLQAAIDRAEHELAAAVETHDTAKRDPKRVTWPGHDPLADHVAHCQRGLEGERHKLRKMTSKYEAEAV
jgi:chromosome segregation ATPase